MTNPKWVKRLKDSFQFKKENKWDGDIYISYDLTISHLGDCTLALTSINGLGTLAGETPYIYFSTAKEVADFITEHSKIFCEQDADKFYKLIEEKAKKQQQQQPISED